jgi:MSHA biogenesis protein MshP
MPPVRGMGAVAAIVILVMLSALAAAIVRLTWVQQLTAASELSSAKALQAAGAGVEWGMFQALTTGGSWVGCTNSSQTLDLRATMGVWVTVKCNAQATPYLEGQDATGTPREVRVYQIEAVACNGATSCPDDGMSASPIYVERKRQATVTDKLTSQ